MAQLNSNSIFGKKWTVNTQMTSNSIVTAPKYPFIGPRFLNKWDSKDTRKTVPDHHWRSYYSFLRGGDTHFLEMDRRMFDLGTVRYLDYLYPYIFEFNGNYKFPKHVHGYIQHRPADSWLIHIDNAWIVRNELDSVGYVGHTSYLYAKDSLGLLAARSLNILPSLHAKECSAPYQDPERIVQTDGRRNYLVLPAWNDEEKMLFIQVSEYDCYMLARKTYHFPGIDAMIGREGCVYVSDVYAPLVSALINMDGYRFWYWLYNDLRHQSNIGIDFAYYDAYFSGTSLRNQRRSKQHYDRLQDVVYPIEFADNVTLQGATMSSMFGVVDSVNHIGKLAKNATDMQDKVGDLMNLPWVKEILNFITSVSNQLSGIIEDFNYFCTDPFAYVKNIARASKILFINNLTVYDSTKCGILLALAYYLYDKAQILSIGLFLYAYGSFFSQCYPHERITRSVTLVATFASIGVIKATQLRPASISLQNANNVTDMIHAAIAMCVLGCGLKGTLFNEKSLLSYISNQTKDVFNISKGVLSLGKVLDYVVSASQKIFSAVFGDSFLYKTLVSLTVSSQDLKDYIEYCLGTNPEDLATKLTLDHEARVEWVRICALHKELIKLFASGKPPAESHIGFSMYSRAAASFIKLRCEYDKIKDSLDHFRCEPFMVWIWGKPGTGKTWCRDRFVNNMYRWHSEFDPTLPDVKSTGLLYVRNPADKFMSKYKNQFALGYDDVGQNRQADNPEFNEIMGFGSTNQVRLNMADLEDKGRLFSSKVVIMAANSKNVVANNMILKEEAFNRRRHLVIEIVREEIVTEDLTTSKCDFTKVRLNITDPITGNPVISFPPEGYGEEEETFRSMFGWLAPRYIKHVETQMAGIAKKEESLRALIEGKSDPAIYDYPTTSLKRTVVEGDTVDAVNRSGGKFYLLAQLMKHDDDLREIMEAIKMSVEDPEIGEPTPFLLDEFNSQCKEKLDFTFDDNEWQMLKRFFMGVSLEPEHLEKIDECWKQVMEQQKTKTPWWKIISGIGALGALFSLYKIGKKFFTTDDIFVQGYSDVVRTQKQNKISVQQYSVETRAARNARVTVQNDETPEFTPSNIDQVNHNIRKSLAHFIHNKDGQYMGVIGFNVCYDLWLIPRHFFHQSIQDTKVYIEQAGQPRSIVNIRAEDVTECLRRVGDESMVMDMCIVRISGMPHGRNHVKHFAKRVEIERCRNFNGKMLHWSKQRKMVEEVCLGEVRRWDRPLVVENDGIALYYSSGYKYNYASAHGDCGAPIVSLDTTTASRIYGIHFGFDNIEKRGVSYHLSREDVEQLVASASRPEQQITAQDPDVKLQASECPTDLKNENGEEYFEYLGYVKDASLPPKDHGDLYRSPLYGQVYPAEKDLSVLRKFDSRLGDEYFGNPDILVRGVKDFSYETEPWPQEELEIASEALMQEFDKFKTPMEKRILTVDEAINGVKYDGIRVPYSEPINLKTSAGYGLSGVKRDHFRTKPGTESNVEYTISNPELQEQVDKMWNSWQEGRTYPMPWTHTLKIEPLKLSKIVQGNTRTFCVASTAYLLNVRRLFGAFTASMKSSKISSFSCLGVDATSTDWNDLYNNLRDVGPMGADMDFFKFDRTAVTWQLAQQVCHKINEFYDDGPINARMRIIAFEDLIFSYALVNKHLTRKSRGNPSGNPLTTELNNCINYLMLCMVYLLIAKQCNPSQYGIAQFAKNIRAKTYGDDIIYTLHPECVEWFDFEMLERIYAHYGVPVTPADKTDTGITLRPLHELTFLKRHFIPFDHHFVKWQGALSKSSIRNMIQFYRLKPNNGTMMEAVRENCMESLKEAYHWGKVFFNDHLKNINTWMHANDYERIRITYEELDAVYRSKING